MGIHLDFSGKQEACTLSLFGATKFCIRPVSNNFDREAGGVKVQMPAWTGRRQWEWAHMRCIACVVVEGRTHLEGGSRERVGHQCNGLSKLFCV